LRRIMLFVSSYIPLYVLLIVKNLLERCSIEGRLNISLDRLKTIRLFDEINDYAICVLILLCIVSFAYLKHLTKSQVDAHYYKLVKIEDQTGNVYFNYISIYLLSCLGLTLQNIVDVFILLFLMVLVGCIYVSNHMTYMNPVLQFMGFKVYEGTICSLSTNKNIETIIIVNKEVAITEDGIYTGSGKEDFIYLTTRNEEN